MDDYSKTGPKTPRADAKFRERQTLQHLQRLLRSGTEEEFLAGLRKEPFRIDPNHPKYKKMILLWRERNFQR
jgi:hypothetical protein